ncbi:toprim domain-containing protein [Riemerella anatipestifer]|uniref:toprim domain-containing protein n=1 Tax=Riemerella anatipestifer TaxID=34085 RepID=UPI001F3AC3EE|nr:toprim domain-containing protein [Riemerella anatipestifer]WRU41610.1 toprim domain-containing protein [Riemerella anatipestifer]
MYLDNDRAGDLLAEKLNKLHSNVIDQRNQHKDFKDLNEYLISKKSEEQIHIEEKPTYKMRR